MGCVPALPFHQYFQRYTLTTGAIPTPVGQQGCDEAGIGDDADVRTAITKPRHGVFREQHVAAAIQIAVGVVGEGAVKHGAAIVLEQPIWLYSQGDDGTFDLWTLVRIDAGGTRPFYTQPFDLEGDGDVDLLMPASEYVDGSGWVFSLQLHENLGVLGRWGC